MSDRPALHQFIRRAALNGGSVDARSVGYLMADHDHLLTAVRAALAEDDGLSSFDVGPRPALAALRQVVTEITT
jgi:hypothetical protein